MKLRIYDNSYTCGDGCCYDYWFEAEVDGELLKDGDTVIQFRDSCDILSNVLSRLGVEVEYLSEYTYE